VIPVDFHIIGSGGHAKVVIQVIRACGHRAVKLFDDDPQSWGKDVMGVPVVGSVAEILKFDSSPTVIAVGNNRDRSIIATQFACNWTSIVHPRAVVDDSAKIGPGSVVMAGCVIQANASIGCHCIVNTSATIDHDTTVGDFCHLCPGVNLAGNVRVDEGVLLGVASSAIPGVRIGDWSTIGAGSTVIRDIPEHSVAVGVPASYER